MSLLPEATAEVPPTALADSARHAAGVLAAKRSAEGCWLFAEAAPDPDFVLLQLWLHTRANETWDLSARQEIEKTARGLLQRQLPDGGFNTYGEGPSDLDLTIKAYVALKLAGLPVDDPRMLSAREAAIRLGGLDAADGLVKVTLSVVGLYPRKQCPALPPELLLLPGSNIHALPASLRSTVVCLAVLQALDVRCSAPEGFNLDELRTAGANRGWQYAGVFSRAALLHRVCSAAGLRSVRAKATKRAAEWLEERKPTGALAAMAADALGYQTDYSAPSHAFRDTAAAAFALGEFGYPPDMRKTGDWLLSREIRPAGWSVGGESFASIPDTALGLSALAHTKATNEAAWQSCRSRSVKWLLEKQSNDGGWAQFDANHEADPRYADVTGVVLEALSHNGVASADPAVQRAVEYLFRVQEQDGSWSGQQGMGYIGATCLVLRGLQAGSVSDREAAILRAGEWLRSIQNADGGWGESAASIAEGSYVPAKSDSWRTASAILGLLAGGDQSSLSVNKGIEYLADSQRSDGTWEEAPGAGAGISEASYLSYYPYRNTFPLLALASFLRTRREVPQG